MTSLTASPPQRLVLADLLRVNSRAYAVARDAALIVAGALVIAALAQVRILLPDNPIPVTGQTLAVLLTAASLGPVRGMLASLTYVVLGLFLPFYAGGREGVDVLFGASGGYLIGFIPAAFLIGLAAKYGMDRQPWKAIPLFIGAQLFIFGIGVPWLGMVAGYDLGTAIAKGFTPFVVAELVKAAIAGVVLPVAWGLTRGLRS